MNQEMIVKILDVAFLLAFSVYTFFLILMWDNMVYPVYYMGYWLFILIPFLFFKFIMLIRGRKFIINIYSLSSAIGFIVSFIIQFILIKSL